MVNRPFLWNFSEKQKIFFFLNLPLYWMTAVALTLILKIWPGKKKISLLGLFFKLFLFFPLHLFIYENLGSWPFPQPFKFLLCVQTFSFFIYWSIAFKKIFFIVAKKKKRLNIKGNCVEEHGKEKQEEEEEEHGEKEKDEGDETKIKRG